PVTRTRVTPSLHLPAALPVSRLAGCQAPGADELPPRGHAPVAAAGGLVPATATVAVPAAEDDDSARDQRDDRRDRPVAPQGPGPGRRPVTVAGGRAAGPLLGGGHPGAPLPSQSSPPGRGAAAAPAGRR